MGFLESGLSPCLGQESRPRPAACALIAHATREDEPPCVGQSTRAPAHPCSLPPEHDDYPPVTSSRATRCRQPGGEHCARQAAAGSSRPRQVRCSSRTTARSACGFFRALAKVGCPGYCRRSLRGFQRPPTSGYGRLPALVNNLFSILLRAYPAAPHGIAARYQSACAARNPR